MDAFLGNISARQAKEWELFSREEPLFEDKVMIQIAKIAQLFASYFISTKGGVKWKVTDFIPDFTIKEVDSKEFSSNLLNTLGVKSKKEEKRVKYSLEDKVKEKNSLPKRLRKNS